MRNLCKIDENFIFFCFNLKSSNKDVIIDLELSKNDYITLDSKQQKEIITAVIIAENNRRRAPI